MAAFCTGFFIVMTALQITVEGMRKKALDSLIKTKHKTFPVPDWFHLHQNMVIFSYQSLPGSKN